MKDFFTTPELIDVPNEDERGKVSLEGDALVAVLRSMWNNLAVSSPHIEPIRDQKISTHQRTSCEKLQAAASRLRLSVASQWEMYLSECERRLERKFDSEIMCNKFATWMADRAVTLNRSPV